MSPRLTFKPPLTHLPPAIRHTPGLPSLPMKSTLFTTSTTSIPLRFHPTTTSRTLLIPLGPLILLPKPIATSLPPLLLPITTSPPVSLPLAATLRRSPKPPSTLSPTSTSLLRVRDRCRRRLVLRRSPTWASSGPRPRVIPIVVSCRRGRTDFSRLLTSLLGPIRALYITATAGV
jgi:hypothetical protein